MAGFGKTLDSALSRRAVFRGLAGFLAGSPLLRSQQDPFRDHSRVPALREMLDAFDFEPVMFAKVTRQAYDYMAWGVDGEFTMRRNREAYDWVGLVPRALAGTGPVQTASKFLGMDLAFPITISPTARHVLFSPDAEMATHAGATAASNTPLIVSNVATLPVEKIAAAATGPWWFQLYPQRGSDYNRQTLDKAQAAGCRAIVVTVDQQASVYERQTHDQNLTSPTGPVLAPTTIGAPRQRHSESSGAGRERRLPGPRAAVGFGGLRRAGGAEGSRNPASRTGSGHGGDRPADAGFYR